MRSATLAIALAVFLATGTTAVASGAPAPHYSKSCGVTAKGSSDYRVKARAIKCRFARRWVKRYLRSESEAPGFDCIETDGGQAPFYCTKGSTKAYWALRL